MLSSLGFNDSKGTGRNNRTGPSRFFPDMMSRGFSAHVFKHSFAPSQPPPPPPPAPPVPKYEAAQTRPPPGAGGMWNRQMSYQASRNEGERKQAPLPLSQDRRLVQVPQPASQPWPVETKKSQSKGYAIYPSLESDMFIYERSILSVDDVLSSSPSSDSSSDSDLFGETAMANLEISSTRASTSTETLESTLYGANANHPGGGRGAITALAHGHGAAPVPIRPPLAITAPPPPPPSSLARATSTRGPPAEASVPARPVITLSRTESHRARTTSLSHPVHPIQFSAQDTLSDSDSDTAYSDTQANAMIVDMPAPSHWAMSAAGFAHSARSTTPSRRDQPEPRVVPRREPGESGTAMRVPASAPPQYRTGDEGRPEDVQLHPRAPPGLYGAVATPPDAQFAGPRGPALSTSAVGQSPTAPSAVNSPSAGSPPRPQVQTQSSGSPTQLVRTPSMRPAAEAPVRNEPSLGAPSTSPPTSSPPRKNSQTSSPQGSPTAQTGGVIAVAASKRTVRWTEDLVCPSPVPFENRRKGWFNRRGDQLWTNEGQFKAPEPGQEYPPDLANYPEPNTGWMNEEGTRIDMQHRLVPKRPLRSALKQPKSRNTV